MDKAMKEAETVTQTDGMTERVKAQQLGKLTRKGLSKGEKEQEDNKVAKGVNRGVKGSSFLLGFVSAASLCLRSFSLHLYAMQVSRDIIYLGSVCVI